MKRSTILSLMLIAVTSLLFVQCTHEIYEGADGMDGADGADGIDGIDGEFVCVSCHNDSHRDSITAAFNYSKHYNQTVMYTGQLLSEYTNRTSCARCHTNEGFIEYAETGTVSDTVPVPQGVKCTTCHSTHDTFDFETDGPDYALRLIEPVQLVIDDTYFIDMGTSNACINCHQPRRAAPEDDGTGLFEITSEHWGPHHGPQSTMLEGINGAEVSGSIAYPAPRSATHRTGADCVTCHMGATTDGTDGSHSFSPTDNACIVCHTNGAPDEVSGLAAELETLGILLEQVVSQDGTVTGIVHDGHPQPGVYTVEEAQAAWNYLFIQVEDKSLGTHNPAYARALVRNSIETLQ